MPRTIGFIGSLALLVSGLTGPSLAVIPLLFQQAGWLTPLIAFALIAFLTGSATLFVIEVMASIQGNEEFQASIEFTTIAHLYLGKRWHWAVQIVLYVALQSLIITSLIESFQSMDSLLISVAHKTCAISFQNGWICEKTMLTDGNGVFSDYILFSFGTLITFAMIVPLSLIHLTDNIIFQIASFILLIIIAVIWIATYIQVGLDKVFIPVVASNQSNVVGFILSNFAFVTTAPAWINNAHPSVNIRLVVWLSLVIACLIYIPIGWMGASAFAIGGNATILSILSSSRPNIVALISTYVFPVAVLITSVPVFVIVVRYNLLRGNICSNRMAIFLSAVVPWLIAIPFQTRGWIAIILNWTSLVFASPANLLFPFFFYIASKRYKALALLDTNVQPSADNRNSIEAGLQRGLELVRTRSTRIRSTRLPPPPLPVLIIPNEKSRLEADDFVRLVRSPSRYRYYADNSANEASGSQQPESEKNEAEPSKSELLALPGSPTSVRPMTAGTDDFILHPIADMPPVTRQPTLSTTTKKSEEPPVTYVDPVPPQPTFEAFPFLCPSSWWSWCPPTRVAGAEGVITFVLVLAAFIDSIVESVKGNGSGLG